MPGSFFSSGERGLLFGGFGDLAVHVLPGSGDQGAVEARQYLLVRDDLSRHY